MTEFKPFQVIWKLLPYSFMWRTDYILDAIKCTSISKSFCGIRSLWTKPKRCTMVSLFCWFGLVSYFVKSFSSIIDFYLLATDGTWASQRWSSTARKHHHSCFYWHFSWNSMCHFHHYFSFIMTVNSLIQRLVILPNLLIPYLNLYSSSHLLSYSLSQYFSHFN